MQKVFGIGNTKYHLPKKYLEKYTKFVLHLNIGGFGDCPQHTKKKAGENTQVSRSHRN